MILFNLKIYAYVEVFVFILFYFIFHLSCLVFSELSGSVFWCLTLIWGKFTLIIVSNISPVSFPFWSLFLCMLYLLHLSHRLWIFCSFSVFVLFAFQVESFLLVYPLAQRCCSHGQSTNKLIKMSKSFFMLSVFYLLMLFISSFSF